MINFKRKIGIDVDDVLMDCVPIAVQLVNENELDELDGNPLNVDEITAWKMTTKRGRRIIKYFQGPELYERQRPLPGAQKFIKKLSEIAEVFITTAIEKENTEFRIKQIQKYFPEVDPRNIIPSYRKDVIHLDFTLDDGAHNILKSSCLYPVLMRKPWNKNMTGILAVNSYDEFLSIVECVNSMYTMSYKKKEPLILALVGPAGSGKSDVANELVVNHNFAMPKSVTTRHRRGPEDSSYSFVSKDEFKRLKKENAFAETSVYAGEYFGSVKESIDKYLQNNTNVVLPVDISGAIALKMAFDNVVIAYIQKDRSDILDTLLNRVVSKEAKIDDIKYRILSLDNEKRNKIFCDIIVDNNSTLRQSCKQIIKDLNL